MGHKKRKEPNAIDFEREKNTIFYGALPLAQYRRDYYIGFHYNYWMHKALIFSNFINNPEKLKEIPFELNRDSPDYIIENLKMEMHMMVFHSAESLFLHVLGRYLQPDCPWCWVSSCSQDKTRRLISIIGEKGISSIIANSEQWFRDVLYPTIDSKNSNYEKTKLSASFVVEYMDRLATEYQNHREYNSYKHGLTGFPIRGKLEVVDEQSGERNMIHEGDMVTFLESDKTREASEMKVAVSSSNKVYDVSADFEIIQVTSAVLLTLFERERMNYKASKENPLKYSYIFFDDQDVNKIFRNGLRNFSY